MINMNKKCEIYENINGKQLILSRIRIGKLAGGCQITLKFQDHQNINFLFVGIIPLIITILLQCIIEIPTMFYIAILIVLVIVLYLEVYKIKSENVSLIPHIGLQYSVEYKSGINKDIFIQWENIDSFVINEVIEKQRIIYLATVITKNQSNELSLVSLFRTTKPRLKCLEEIYIELQTILEKYNNT